ncbi:bacterial type II secretion system protein F domain protein [mine drainage metagenome]|uniref:Bacterial type II secretion system protein F domain protein n=1 Tax=mine drainage metagenome TaxID=410659 RepID=A0A1J5R301_9ZZZZ
MDLSGGQRLDMAAALIVGLAAWIAYVRAGRPAVRAAQRARDEALRYVRRPGRPGEEQGPASLRGAFSRLLADWGGRLPLFTPKQQKELSQLLVAAGVRQVYGLQLLVAVKVLCGGLGVAAALFVLGSRPAAAPFSLSLLVMLSGFMVGMIAPELLLKRWVRWRRRRIHRFLSDALDLMVICTNAGYSLSATLRTVATEMKPLCPPLADELELTFHETQVSADTVAALRHLAERTGVDSVRSLVTTLIQSHRYGTPITQALKVLARSERAARLLRLEEMGAKLSVKITLPMMLLILPAVFIVIGAPAYLSLTETLAK